MPFDKAAAAAYGPIRFSDKQRRKDLMDKLIASHAAALDATLVTNNVADFERYPDIRIANWAD
jgi:tRNA(fMet)-specific endonuclease VapC